MPPTPVAPERAKQRWQVLGSSVRGSSHLRSGLPNQDAIAWSQEAGTILALADGHGSPKCFRSDRGARFAVRSTQSILSRSLCGLFEARAMAGTEQALSSLAAQIVLDWQRQVDADIEASPFLPSEFMTAEVRRSNGMNPRIAYGSTLLSAGIVDDAVFCLQIGDGDILAVSDDADVNRILARSELKLGDETESLAMENAARQFRFYYSPAGGPAPALILLSTDGYANSFRNDSGFLSVGRDILDIIRTDGLDHVDRNLGLWLSEASRLGSGDDATMGILWRSEPPENL